MINIILALAVAIGLARAQSQGQLTTPTPTAACANVDPYCARLGSFFCTGAYQQWASENCKLTCGLCGSGAVTTPIPIVSGTCNYTGMYYNQGETWVDGCELKCICADASRGYYTCGARCLTWKLPPACHLDPPAPGKCCKVPSCPSGYVINYPAGYKEE